MNNSDKKNKLYCCSRENYPELLEDLIITGGHSVLVSELTDKQRKETTELMGKIYITGKKYRLMVCLDDRSNVYEKEGEFTIYHFALENECIFSNYGVYANGLCVESISINHIQNE